MVGVSYNSANSIRDIQGILQLQQLNLLRSVSPDQRRAEGFVTVEHDEALLWSMNHPFPHVIAEVGDRIVGYTLVMEQKWRHRIAVLFSMFEQIDQVLETQNSLGSNYFVMGQVCVAEDYRGKGVFRGLYDQLKKSMSPHFELCITEIALENQRSLEAHLAVGFEEFHRHRDETGVDWVLVQQDYRRV
jgi:predicted GNAT family N-acyltransferase